MKPTTANRQQRPKTLFISLLLLAIAPIELWSQTYKKAVDVLIQPGILITLILVLIPLLLVVVLLYNKTSKLVKIKKEASDKEEADRFAHYLLKLEAQDVEAVLQKRKEVLRYRLSNDELSGGHATNDNRGIISNVEENSEVTFVPVKKKAQERPAVNPKVSKMILWYLGSAAFWLIFGTTIGEYLGIKFVSPDVDDVSWLSFGRLRPVHTNAVFWGWCSLAMLGLGNYVVPTVSNTELASYKKGWYALALINASVIIGSLCLMAGVNNGGGEYREYTWPVMGLFGLGLLLSLSNFWKTVAMRKTKEIYISNWYIISAIFFTLTIAFVAYWPSWQNGLGETIIQGYYMHQGVGMWFMLFNLGLIYYFLPQQLNKPIYSYSLGVIAFWSQIFFYTVIGTHHFVFSSIPWWLQTVAIVGSVGMLIPVFAGTTNFFMSFNGAWSKVK
ncbi:MAG TPA: cbb3-type cytochrome c oxidase subunit I, partial [Chitinophagaceae bacterium]|nr:cbb3-type cytochrome c oxidase subunit I [Chitinophagaceae bacterium]